MRMSGDFSTICRTIIWCNSSRNRVGDPRILRLIQKWLKAGVSEEGEWSETKVGYSARGGDLAATSEHLPALRSRSLGGAVAEAIVRMAM